MVEPPRDDEVIGHVLIEETDMSEEQEDVQGHSHNAQGDDEGTSSSHGLKSHGLKSHNATDDDVQGHSHGGMSPSHGGMSSSHNYADDDEDDVQGHSHN